MTVARRLSDWRAAGALDARVRQGFNDVVAELHRSNVPTGSCERIANLRRGPDGWLAGVIEQDSDTRSALSTALESRDCRTTNALKRLHLSWSLLPSFRLPQKRPGHQTRQSVAELNNALHSFLPLCGLLHYNS